MAIDSTITVGQGSVFTLQGYNPTGSVRIETNSSLAEPNLLTISHETIKATPSRAARDAHLVKNTVTVLDAQGRPQTASVYFRFDLPRTGDFDTGVVRAMLCNICGVVLGDDFALTGVTAADNEGIDKLADILLGLS